MSVKNHKIIFIIKKTETDELGQETVSWINSGHSSLASVSPVSGRLYYESKRNNDEETVLFVFRFSNWMKELNKIDYRIQFNNTTYEIKHISNIKERNREMELRCISID